MNEMLPSLDSIEPQTTEQPMWDPKCGCPADALQPSRRERRWAAKHGIEQPAAVSLHRDGCAFARAARGAVRRGVRKGLRR